jgi:hypothetical protein
MHDHGQACQVHTARRSAVTQSRQSTEKARSTKYAANVHSSPRVSDRWVVTQLKKGICALCAHIRLPFGVKPARQEKQATLVAKSREPAPRVAASELARTHRVGSGIAAERGRNGVSVVHPELLVGLPHGGEGYELPWHSRAASPPSPALHSPSQTSRIWGSLGSIAMQARVSGACRTGA